MEKAKCDYKIRLEEITTIGAMIRSYRMACGLTQAELAQRISYSNAMIGRFERGTHQPKERAFELLAETFSWGECELLHVKKILEKEAETKNQTHEASQRPNASFLEFVESLLQKTKAEKALSEPVPFEELIVNVGLPLLGKAFIFSKAKANKGVFNDSFKNASKTLALLAMPSVLLPLRMSKANKSKRPSSLAGTILFKK